MTPPQAHPGVSPLGRVAFVLPALRSYPDRVRMVAALSEHTEHLSLVTDEVPEGFDDLFAEHPRLEMVPLGRVGFSGSVERFLDTRESQWSVVHDTFGFLAGWFQARASERDRRIRLVTTLYTTNTQWFDEIRHQIPFNLHYASQRLRALWRDARLLPNADRVLVLGPGHEREVIDRFGVPPERVAWVPSETDLDRFTPLSSDVPHREALDRHHVLYAGVVFRTKGIDLLMEAVARLRPRYPDLRLTLAGITMLSERAWLARALRDLDLRGTVRLTGRIPQEALLALYRRAAVFAFPSRFEGSPRAVREAVACGCRTLVSDIPGNRGVDPEGRFLRFVDRFDARAWAEGLDALLVEPTEAARQRAAQGRSHLLAHHAPSRVADRLAQEYALARRAPPRGSPPTEAPNL